MSDLNRRALLCTGCQWAVAGAVASVTGCVVSSGGSGGGSTAGGDDDDDDDDVFDTGTAALSTPECDVVAQPGAPGWAELSLAQYPELDAVDGWVQVSVGGRTLNVAQVDVDCFVAMETSCTHQGARVDYRPERGQFVCILHGAVYVNDGTPISGPTQVPLVTYPCARSGDSVWVQVG